MDKMVQRPLMCLCSLTLIFIKAIFEVYVKTLKHSYHQRSRGAWVNSAVWDPQLFSTAQPLQLSSFNPSLSFSQFCLLGFSTSETLISVACDTSQAALLHGFGHQCWYPGLWAGCSSVPCRFCPFQLYGSMSPTWLSSSLTSWRGHPVLSFCLWSCPLFCFSKYIIFN